MVENISKLLSDLEENRVLELVKELIQKGENPNKILEAVGNGMRLIGERWKSKEYFTPEVIFGAEISHEITEILNPILENNINNEEKKPIILIGTVKGDIHDIGKNIIISLLRAEKFGIYDLGVDLPPEVFIEKIKELKPNILGLSGLLTLAVDSMKELIDKISEEGLRENIKIIIGGPFLSEKTCNYVGADAYTNNGDDGIEIIKNWMVNYNGKGC